MSDWRFATGIVAIAAIVICVCIGVVAIDRDHLAEREAKRAKDAIPALICEREGVKLWRVYDKEQGKYVYFSTPHGNIVEGK